MTQDTIDDQEDSSILLLTRTMVLRLLQQHFISSLVPSLLSSTGILFRQRLLAARKFC
jgi:hypothetical protein